MYVESNFHFLHVNITMLNVLLHEGQDWLFKMTCTLCIKLCRFRLPVSGSFPIICWQDTVILELLICHAPKQTALLFLSQTPPIDNIFIPNTEKSNFVFQNSCDHILDCSCLWFTEITTHSLKLPYLTSTVWYEIAWAWSIRLLSRELQKCLYCWYKQPKQCSFGTTNPNFFTSVLDFSDLTQWQVAMGKKQTKPFSRGHSL